MCCDVITGDLPSKLKGYDDEEEDEEDMMAVEGSDGQQYVVLEVIQLADNQGTDQVNDLRRLLNINEHICLHTYKNLIIRFCFSKWQS